MVGLGSLASAAPGHVFLHHSPCAGRPCLTPVILPQIIVSTGISYGVNLKEKFGISVVGNIPSG